MRRRHRICWMVLTWGLAFPLRAQVPYPTGAVEVPVYQIPKPSFALGESLHYDFSWSGIRAGEGEISVSPGPEGSNSFHLQAKASTVGLARLLWKMEDSVESQCLVQNLKPATFLMHVREPSLRYELEVRFDHARGVATSIKTRSGKVKQREIEFHNAYDPLSLAFFIRSLDWKAGDERSFEMVDGQDRYLLVLRAVAEEEVTVRVGTYSAVKFVPILIELPRRLAGETPPFFERLRLRESQKSPVVKTLEFWMAKDGPRPLLRVRSEAWIGHVDMELTIIKNPGFQAAGGK
ncbi:MAG: hypothetical protein A2V67_19140 [Deltaproteobacteria bacterium RBG_13_61_14]|nr:MAG: hypothetical protein A2V67_19140 [Deltaproteobacteria bacterium RBG_13_61_14]